MKVKEYYIPKTNVYTGDYNHIETTITQYHYNEQDLKVTNDFKPLSNYKHYISIVGLSDIKKIEKIKDYYHLEDTILEDIFNVKQRTRLEYRENYVFGVLHVQYIHEENEYQDYMSLLMFEDTVITFHEKPPIFLEALPELLKKYKVLKTSSIDFLLYQIMDIVTDHQLTMYEWLEMTSTQFEEEILESKEVDQEKFYLIRKKLLHLKASVSPMLEELTTFLNRKNHFVKSENEIYYDDLKDHLQRLDTYLNQSREQMRHLLDLHINNQSNKMNRIMTTLTLFSAIFIPLSFLTGFFGMNFVHFDILEYEHSLAIFIGLCFLLAGFMFLLFKKMKWF